MIGQDLLLVLQDRLLVPDDLGLVGENRPERVLVPQDLRLVGDDGPVVRDDLLLIPESRLCHCLLLVVKVWVVPDLPAHAYYAGCGFGNASIRRLVLGSEYLRHSASLTECRRYSD